MVDTQYGTQSKEAETTGSPITAATKLLQEGRRLAGDGDFKSALKVVETALTQEGGPASLSEQLLISLMSEKAWLHRAAGEPDRAEETYKQLTKLVPESVEGWLGRGLSLFAKDSLEEALNCADRAIQADRQSANGYALRGDCLMRLRRWDEAFAAFELAAQHDPILLDASDWASRGDRFLRAKQADIALKAYEMAVAQDPSNPEGWHGKAVVLRERGELDAALESFRRSSEVNKGFIAGYLDAGRLCFDRREYDKALDLFVDANKHQPEDPRPLVAIGGLHAELGEYEKAVAAYDQAVGLDPDNGYTLNMLGNCLVRLGRVDDALRTYDKAMEVAPDFGWVPHNRSLVLNLHGRFPEALQAAKRAVEIEPDNSEFMITLLRIAYRLDRDNSEEIGRYVDQLLLKVGDARADIRARAANALAEIGQFDRARELLREIDISAIVRHDERLEIVETLLLLDQFAPAVGLLRGMDLGQLSHGMRAIWYFFSLLADRLLSAPVLSELLLEGLLRELQQVTNAFQDGKWSFTGVRDLLERSELPVHEKFVLATLADIQEGIVSWNALSFFTQIWTHSRVHGEVNT